jgi:tetratricopeptide (TPR) repeat protein
VRVGSTTGEGSADATRLSEALSSLEQVVYCAQVLTQSHGTYVSTLLRMGRRQEAEEALSRALTLPPGTFAAYDTLAFAALTLGSFEISNALYKRAADVGSSEPVAWYNLASSERSFGRFAEAVSACDHAIALNPKHLPSLVMRSELQRQTPESNHVLQLQALLDESSHDDRFAAPLHYALAKELDDLEHYDSAFEHFVLGAAARRRRLNYDVSVDEQKMHRIAECFPAPGQKESSIDGAGFAFIVGLPRSGTTLVERILSGHVGARSNGETDNFMRALLKNAPHSGGDIFSRSAQANPDDVAKDYAQLSNSGPTDRLVLEKLPLNFLYLGAIRRALPRAKIISVRRSPLDSCFAMFRTLFGTAYPFTYEFDDLARYYAAYENLMAHWSATSEQAIFEIWYEDLVAKPDKVGCDMARYCELTWSEAALDLSRNSSISMTASAAQIRGSIYSSSVTRLAKYESHLSPLAEALKRHRRLDLRNSQDRR